MEQINTDELISELNVSSEDQSIIIVAGIGGAGGNAVNHMWNMGIQGVTFMVCNTDSQALHNSPVPLKVQMGEGLGAGNDPEKGRAAAIESLDDLRQQIERIGAKMIFITAGMGGGTGTGASPVIAKLAHEMGLLTVAIVTSPLVAEGMTRYEQAFKGIDELRQNVDSLLLINNEDILEMYGNMSLRQAFNKADDILASATKGIAEIITVTGNLVNVDFADVHRVMKGSGTAHVAVAVDDSENRALEVAKKSLDSPLLNKRNIMGAKNILLNISTDKSDHLLLKEVNTILQYIQEQASTTDENGTVRSANIIWGTGEKAQLGNAIELMIVATGFEEKPSEYQAMPPRSFGKSQKPEVQRAPETPTSPLGRPATPLSPAGVVVLMDKANRYEDIADLKSGPAYRRRKTQLVEQASTGIPQESITTEQTTQEESPSAELFSTH